MRAALVAARIGASGRAPARVVVGAWNHARMDIQGRRRGRRIGPMLRGLAERLGLAAATGLATSLVLVWGGLAWPTARLAGAAAGVVVMVASWASSTVPPPSPPPGTTSRPTRPAGAPERTRPGEQRQS